MDDLPIEDVLREMGITPGDMAAARAALEEVGLTRPGKVRLVRSKVARAQEALRRHFALSCGAAACLDVARQQGRPLLRVDRAACPVCGGSSNRFAVSAMVEAMDRCGVRRLLVLGGTPRLQRELLELLPSWVTCRFVLADDHRNGKEAAQEAAWADIIIIWASTPIPHKTTALYVPYHPLLVSRRGIAALAERVTQALAGGGAVRDGRGQGHP